MRVRWQSSEGKCLFAAIAAADDLIMAPAIVVTNSLLTAPVPQGNTVLTPLQKVLVREDTNMIAEIIMVANPVLTTATQQNNAVGCAPNSEPPKRASTDYGDTETGESEYRVSSTKGSIDDEEMLDHVESEDEIHKGCDELDETDDVKSFNDSVDSMPEKFWAPEVDKKFQLVGIFEVEAIIDDRTIGNGGREYCIKWKGFTLNDCTWEPERNIFDPNLIRQYKMEKLLKEIEATPEAKIPLSPSAKVAAALAIGLKRVWSIPLKRKRLAKTCKRLCPFCCQSFNDGIGVLSHLKSHSTLSNFAIIRDAARVLDIAWYKSHEQDHTNGSRKVGNG